MTFLHLYCSSWYLPWWKWTWINIHTNTQSWLLQLVWLYLELVSLINIKQNKIKQYQIYINYSCFVVVVCTWSCHCCDIFVQNMCHKAQCWKDDKSSKNAGSTVDQRDHHCISIQECISKYIASNIMYPQRKQHARLESDLNSSLSLNVLEASIFQHDFLEGHDVWQ